MKSILVFRLLLVAVGLLVGAVVVRAEDLHAIKARMEQRQSAVDLLKEHGLVGEDNRGLLSPRGTLDAAQQKTVSDENTDRQNVYTAIASRNGTSADVVGRARAAKIAATSKAGVWVQSPDGAWSQKH